MMLRTFAAPRKLKLAAQAVAWALSPFATQEDKIGGPCPPYGIVLREPARIEYLETQNHPPVLASSSAGCYRPGDIVAVSIGPNSSNCPPVIRVITSD